MNPKYLIPVGFVLVVFGVVAPFLMVIGVFKSTFLLNFLSFSASVAGVFMGVLGAAMNWRASKRAKSD